MSKKTVMTISGIRPDFIRMSSVFKKLDKEFNHILVHTGQHYDKLLSGVFFEDLQIREPDYTLNTGNSGGTHYHQLGYLSVAIMELLKNENLQPDIILFLGDSNTVCASLPLRKEGYVIGHIEAGMRSHDKRMLEEINRTVCDHCSHILFVYHEDYKNHVNNENIKENVHVVGNTIVEVCKPFIPKEEKLNNMILVDIHRPENYKYKNRMENIIKYANECATKYNLPVKMLKFFGTYKYINEFGIDIGNIELIDLLSYKEYLKTIYHCKFIISDSGTGQEEPAFFKTPVIVPRDFTERPQSLEANCSYMLKADDLSNNDSSHLWLNDIFTQKIEIETEWLGEGKTSQYIIDELKKFLKINLIEKSSKSKTNISKNLPEISININKGEYCSKKPFPYYSQQNILEKNFALKCQDEILKIEDDKWDRYSNPFEGKYTLRDKTKLPPNCSKLFEYLTSESFLNKLSDIVGEKLINDPNRNWWGIHKYDDGDHLDIHTDAGLHPLNKKKKYTTLGIYLSKDWKEENGGHLEIWEGDKVNSDDCKIYNCIDKILPVFNTLVIFNCTDNAWHGNPEPVAIKNGEKRIFVTLSYLSEKYDKTDYSNQLQKAFFIKRPNDPEDKEKDKLRLLRCDPIKYKEIYNIK